MAEPPRVSVIVPTYQRCELVRRAVGSVLAQTYRRFELIVVDDGSTDATEDALAGLSDRLRYVRQENRGASAARNAGLALARGDIVAFLDSDDRWLPQHLDVLVETFDTHAAAVLACTCPGFVAAGNDEPPDARLVDPIPRLLIANDVGHISCVGARRSSVATVGGFSEGLEPAEYNDLVVRLALHGPFALVCRRTVVTQATRGSLLARGRDSGQYLRALSEIARRTAVATRGGPLGERAEGARRFFDALQALSERNFDEVRHALGDACRLFPELSSEPVLVGRQLLNAIPRGDGADELPIVFGTTAELWPEPRSDTAAALRMYAFGFALRAGDARRGASALRKLRFRDASFLIRRRADVGGILRRTLATRVHRGRESPWLERPGAS